MTFQSLPQPAFMNAWAQSASASHSTSHLATVAKGSERMMRVAVAGSGGLAYLIAHYIHEETGHHLILLSRAPKPELEQRGYQVMVVNYNDPNSLDFALTGIDVVISTVAGTLQIKLIESAIRRRVRRFAPAEFEGRPSQRPVDELDRGKASVLAYLHSQRHRIESTVFVCGILYERFAPGGLLASNIGLASGISGEGDYLMNLRSMRAEIPLYDTNGIPVTLCLTAAQDVALFIVRSLELDRWPSELIMCGERMTIQQIVNVAMQIRGRNFGSNIIYHDFDSLQADLALAEASGNGRRATQVQHLIAALDGRYNYVQPNLNATFKDIKPMSFSDWLTRVWTGQ